MIVKKIDLLVAIIIKYVSSIEAFIVVFLCTMHAQIIQNSCWFVFVDSRHVSIHQYMTEQNPGSFHGQFLFRD